jgi:hypothetical protein
MGTGFGGRLAAARYSVDIRPQTFIDDNEERHSF